MDINLKGFVEPIHFSVACTSHYCDRALKFEIIRECKHFLEKTSMKFSTDLDNDDCGGSGKDLSIKWKTLLE